MHASASWSRPNARNGHPGAGGGRPPAVPRGLARAVERADDLELVAACRNGAEALSRIHEHAPDVAVLDLRMPRLTAQAILEELSATDAACAVLVLSAYVAGDDVHECLTLGAAGYIAKDSDRSDICDAIRRVALGRHEKLGVSDRGAAVAEGMRRGLIR